MKALLTLLLILATPWCHAQKWVDERGKVYYGEPPPGVKVRREAMKGGATSTVGAPERRGGGGGGARAPGGRSLDQQEADFQQRNEARAARERQREREDRIISNNREVMKHQKDMAERGLVPSYGPGPKPKR